MLLKFSNNCQENTCTGASFWIKVSLSSRLHLFLLKRSLWYRSFLANVEKHLTTILQFSWMNNLIIQKQSFTDFLKIGVFKSFVIFTEKHLCRNFFPITSQNWSLVFSVKKGSSTGVSSEYWQTFRNSFFIENFRWLLLNIRFVNICYLKFQTTSAFY